MWFRVARSNLTFAGTPHLDDDKLTFCVAPEGEKCGPASHPKPASLAELLVCLLACDVPGVLVPLLATLLERPSLIIDDLSNLDPRDAAGWALCVGMIPVDSRAGHALFGRPAKLVDRGSPLEKDVLTSAAGALVCQDGRPAVYCGPYCPVLSLLVADRETGPLLPHRCDYLHVA